MMRRALMEPTIETNPRTGKRQPRARRGIRMTRRTAALAITAVLALLGAGTAYAYFTSTGSGAGSASTGTLLTSTIAATTGSPSTPLYPGTAGDVVLQVSNPNNFAVTLVSVVGSGTITADGGHPGCTTTGVSFTDQTGLAIPVSANGTTQVDLPGAAAMSSASSDGCQGATFSIPVTITVHK